MIVTTTDKIEGKIISEHLGVVTAEVVRGANLFKDFFAYIVDIFGGRSSSYEDVLMNAQKQALDELMYRAKELGADALVAVRFNVEAVGSSGSMIMVTAFGTAVKIK